MELSAESVILLAFIVGPVSSLFVGALMTLHKYFGGQLKAKCPFFLQFKQVALEIHSHIEWGLFLPLSGHLES